MKQTETITGFIQERDDHKYNMIYDGGKSYHLQASAIHKDVEHDKKIYESCFPNMKVPNQVKITVTVVIESIKAKD